MCRGISVLKNRIRQELLRRIRTVSSLASVAANREELWFDFADRMQTVLLPVICDGQL